MLILALASLAVVVPGSASAPLSETGASAAPRDRDHDGLPDWWERRFGLSTTQKSGAGDPDHDFLPNLGEYRLRLNPRRADTDGDGYKDGAEVRAQTNPKDRSSFPPMSFPTPSTTGVPEGWSPAEVRTTSMTVTTPGAVVENIQFDNADLYVAAPNVIVRNVKFRGGSINNDTGSNCQNGMVVEDTTFEPPPGQIQRNQINPLLATGGYTARRVEMWHVADGFRVGGGSYGCGPVTIENSFVSVYPPNPCGDWHGDGIQGYDGPAVTVRNVTIVMEEPGGCGGTAPFFYPSNQGNTSASIDGLLVQGGGYPFRLGMPGSVRGLKIVDRSWGYGPIDVRCSVLSAWGAAIVTITADYKVASTVRRQPCDTESGT